MIIQPIICLTELVRKKNDCGAAHGFCRSDYSGISGSWWILIRLICDVVGRISRMGKAAVLNLIVSLRGSPAVKISNSCFSMEIFFPMLVMLLPFAVSGQVSDCAEKEIFRQYFQWDGGGVWPFRM